MPPLKFKITVITIFSFLLLQASQTVHAQLNFENLIKSGPADAEKLVEAYANPLLYGFGLGMNSGWTNTAQALKPFHFDIRIIGTGSVVPTSKQTFNVSGIGLSPNLRPSNPSQVLSPTFTGDTQNNGPWMDLFDANNNKLISFELPSAVIKRVVPTPQLQLNMGLFANTEVMVRAAPKIRLGEYFGSISLLGFGIKHNLARDFFPMDREKIPFDFSVLAGFNTAKYSRNLKLLPLDGMIPENENQVADFTTQEIYAKFDNYLFQATLSKEVSFFTPFVSVGYSISKAQLGLKGNYPIANSIRDDKIAYITYSNPFALERTYLKTFRGDVGFQVKLPVLRIYGSYGFSGGYGMLSGGIGIGF